MKHAKTGLLSAAGSSLAVLMAAAPTHSGGMKEGREAMSDARAVSVEYIEAVGRKEFDRVIRLLHPDVEFRMPGRELRGAQEYVAALRRLAPVLLRNEVTKVIAEGKDVGVFYDFVTDTPVGAVPSVEWITVEDGRIRSIWLVFHSQPWPAVLEELSRRVGTPK